MNIIHRCLGILLLLPLAGYGQVPARAPSEELVELDQYVVQGQPIENYRATDALTGTKIGAALLDLPLSINVVARELIEDRRLTSLSESLDNVPGVSRKLGYGGTQNFGAYIRGFDTGVITFRNGFRDFGFYTLRDTANVERFEVLKGPASILYGSLQPGGVTHTLTKRPLPTAFHRGVVTIGSDDFYRAEFDSGGPLSGTAAYRLNLAYEDAGSYRDLVDSRAKFIAPVVTWILSEKTRWTVEMEYKHAEFVWDLGLPKDPVALLAPINRFLGEDDKRNDVQSFMASSVVEHQLNHNWRIRQNAAYAYSGGDYYIRSPLPGITDGRTVNRAAYDSPSYSDNLNLQHELVGNLDIAGMEHQGIVGLDLYRNRDTYNFFFSTIGPIDIFEPVYGARPIPNFLLFGNKITSDAVGLYFQDLVSLRDNLKLLVGARYDSVHYENIDRTSNTVLRRATDEALSPQAGLVFQPTATTSLYASYSSSFVPIGSGVKADGSYLDPEEGEQFEVGVKKDFLDGKFSAMLAAFWITKQNVSKADPANPPFRIQIGEQKSNGVELSFTGSPLPGWDIIAGGAYIDAYVSRDNAIPVGTPMENTPEWSGNTWVKYTFSSGSLRGFKLGAGVYSAGRRQVINTFTGAPLFFLPSYARVDAMLGYARGHWSMQINGKNLTDELIHDLAGTSVMPQQPRSWLLSASYQF